MEAVKNSGIPWIGIIPNDWRIIKIKYLKNDKSNSFVDGDWIESPYITDAGIRYYTTGNIGDGCFKEQGNGYISEATFKELNCKYAYAGDLVFSRLNAPYGRSCILPNNPAKCVLAVDNVILRTDEEKRYICYVSQCSGYQDAVFDKAAGTTMKRISRTNLGNIFIPLPTLPEQQAIADYLDDRCSKMDEIIAEATASIEEYKELKQAVIFEAITKGLDKNVPMKDSGVEWIGEIPVDSSFVKLKYLVTRPITDGTHQTPDYDSAVDGSPFLSSKDVTKGYIDWSKIKYITQKLHEKLHKEIAPQRDDILLAKNGTTGVAAIVDTDAIFDVYVTLAVIRPDAKTVIPKYLLHAINSYASKRQFDDHLIGIGVPNLHLNVINNTKIIVHSKETQQRIVDYLDERISQMDALISEKQALIDDLQAYKKSLIYEVVTGKRRVV